MKIELEQVSPHEIEKRSFEIITEELNGRTFPEDQELVVKRCIHTSTDFDYADNLCFSEHAVAKGIEAIREGACIVTDTQMARSGINKKVLARHGGEALCFMSDEDVAARAKETGSTRAAACMEKAAELDKKLIIAVGNAPTPVNPHRLNNPENLFQHKKSLRNGQQILLFSVFGDFDFSILDNYL